MYPNFLIIGAQKAGTTWLYTNLKKHPDIWLPPIKEIHYFNFKQNNNLSRRILKLKSRHWRHIISEQLKDNLFQPKLENILWNLHFFFGQPNDIWYEKLFTATHEKIVGEATPDYAILSELNVRQIHGLMPKAKILFIVRNPIERAWSYAVMQVKLEGKSVEKVSEDYLLHLCISKASRIRGNYLKTIKIWSEFFPEDQFLLEFFEEIKFDPEGLIYRILEFLELEVPVGFIASLEKKKIFHFGNTGVIPEKIENALARIYYSEILEMNRIYGGHTNQWLTNVSKKLTNDY